MAKCCEMTERDGLALQILIGMAYTRGDYRQEHAQKFVDDAYLTADAFLDRVKLEATKLPKPEDTDSGKTDEQE